MSNMKKLIRFFVSPVSANPYQGTIVLSYRPDIDGLRAFAVLCVVGYHAFPPSVKGGFIGVDIFFVISGYLISSIIFAGLEQNTFSFVEFYSRRIRRIYPALLTVLIAVLTFGWFSLLADEYENLGKHVSGGAFFVANLLLWAESGYFDAIGKVKPLLHLWSLGIEEQFYIFFPLLLWFTARQRFRLITIVIVFGGMSFFDNIYLSQVDRIADFYSPLSRVWELLSGALLSAMLRSPSAPDLFLRLDAVCANILYERQPRNDGQSLSFVLAFLGLFTLSVALLVARDSNPYPAWRALLPVCGTVLLIAAGPANPISKYLLSNRVVVFIGLISYPLYLWHWPLISYAYILNGGLEADTRLLRIGLVGVSFVLATLTWLVIERPVRFAHKRLRVAATLVLLIAMTGVGVSGLVVFYYDGFPERIAPPDTVVEEVTKQGYKDVTNCLDVFPDWKDLNDNICAIQKPIDELSVALIGDSHAGQLFSGLIGQSDTNVFTGVFPASCAAPYIDIASGTISALEFRKNGTFLINRSFDTVLKNKNIKNVILAHDPKCSFTDVVDVENKNIKDRDIILQNGMRRTFDKLLAAQKNVIIVLDNPVLPFDPHTCKKRRVDIFGFNIDCKFKREIFDNEPSRKWYRRILSKVLVDYPTIKVVDLAKILCDDSYCYGKLGGEILYHDTGHLSISGSLLVAPEILKELK